MKKTFLFVASMVAGLISFGQTDGPHPNNVDIGLFANGTNGSNSGSGARVEVALRIKPAGEGYTSAVIADDFVVYLIAPKTDFDINDVVVINQHNTSIFGASTMTQQGAADLGPAYDADNIYFPIALNPSPGMNLSSLSAVTNAWSFAFTFSFVVNKSTASINTLRIVDQNNSTALSDFNGGPLYTFMAMAGSNQLTTTAFSTLPVSLLNFSGYKNGTKNTLRWSTENEMNNNGFDVQRSNNGLNYSTIGFVNSQASSGGSSSTLNYTFDDNNPEGKKQFYRLLQKDIDGRSKLSEIVVVNGEKPKTLAIAGIFPNPASTIVKLIIDAPKRDNLTLFVMDISGKTVKQQSVNVDIGSNTVPLDITKLANGSYLVKIVCQSSDCETVTGKFNKQ